MKISSKLLQENYHTKFRRFDPAMKILESLNPEAIGVVGSYGDSSKAPDDFSDLDVLFVYETEEILVIVQELMNRLESINGIVASYLGVHFQFGHVVNIHFTDDPLCWMDIGIMDFVFANNYLVELPIKMVLGDIQTCHMPAQQKNQLRFLAMKYKKAVARKDHLYILNCAVRYLAWLRVIARSERTEPHDQKASLVIDAENAFSKNIAFIINTVSKDIATRFPNIASLP